MNHFVLSRFAASELPSIKSLSVIGIPAAVPRGTTSGPARLSPACSRSGRSILSGCPRIMVVGIASTGQPDVVVQYKGDAMKISRVSESKR